MLEASSPSLRRAIGWPGLVLLVLGLALRFWAVGHARFTGDESFFWATARNIAVGEAHAFYGPPLTGSSAYHPGPLFYYLLALPQRLGVSPWFGGGFIVLLHGLGAVLLADLARRTQAGTTGARFVLLLWAFAPWDVLYGDRIWLSCVAPIWGLVTLWSATRLDRPAAQTLFFTFALTMPQLHMSAPIVWVAAAVLVVLGPRVRWSWRAIALAAALVLLAYAAPLYNELRTDFQNTRAILREGGGHETGWSIAAVPLRVLGYALLYGSSEIGYHFSTGYWRPFVETDAYFSGAGLAALWAQRGAWSILDAASIAISLHAWVRVLRVERPRWGSQAGAEALGFRLNAALLVGLLAAAVLMMAARKQYFPHYTNLFMPLLLLPPALGLARDRHTLRGLVLAFVTAGAMLSASVRYYRDVDTLNGLDATWSMVETATQGPRPFGVRFDGFDNRFAWQMIAAYGLKQPMDDGAPQIRYRVHNAIGAPPPALTPGATAHGRVVLEVER